MWTYKKADGFHQCKATISKGNALLVYGEVGGTYAGLELTINNKSYNLDEDKQQFNLIINGKAMRSLSDLKNAKTVKAVYGKNKSINIPVKNISIMRMCSQ